MSSELRNKLIDKLNEDLSNIVVEVTGVKKEKIDVDTDINAFGFDSVLMTEFGNVINKKYDVEITPATFFEYNKIHTIAEHLAEDYAQKIEDFYQIKISEPVTSSKAFEPKPRVEIIQLDSTGKREYPIAIMEDRYNNEIAIIGAACIFPGANDLSKYWEVLECRRNCITEIPKDRFDWEDYYNERLSLEGNGINAKWGGFIENIDMFDAEFMGISPQEAELMDPQQRKLLETVWHTLEDAGYNPKEVSGTNVGVFIGVEGVDYSALDMVQGITPYANPYSATGIGLSLVANRISYVYNLHGPSEVISTACSSSLTSVDAAIKAIQYGDCDMALAGGVSALLTPYFYMLLSKLGVLSPDGSCKTFDKDANGYVRGEGIGAILLKPLRKAIEDNDNIYAVIKGIAVNHGGKANSITSPNVAQQVELIEGAYKRANITPDTITYIETHGTGTRLGDPAEINALKKGFDNLYTHYGKKRVHNNYCGLGSVKTNIGHLEPAASVASIIKVILSMRNGMLPGTVHFNELNPYIQIEDSPFYIVEKTKKWERLLDDFGNEIPRRAGISGFGYGGSYAHIVLEEYTRLKKEAQAEQEELFVFSAQNDTSLKGYMAKMLTYLNSLDSDTEVTRGEGEQEKIRILIQSRMNSILSDITNLPDHSIDENEDLFEQGIDNYALSQMLETINTEWEININASEIRNEPTLEKLSTYFINNYSTELTEKFNAKVTSDNKQQKKGDPDLASFAYTLQVGRSLFKSRIAIVAASFAELKAKITGALNKNMKTEGVYVSDNSAKNNDLSQWIVGKPGEAFINSLMNENDLNIIAGLWAQGLEIDWNKLKRNGFPNRISLPGYEFAKDKFWIKTIKYSLNEQIDQNQENQDAKSQPTDWEREKEGIAVAITPAMIDLSESSPEENMFLTKIQNHLVLTIKNLLKLNNDDIDIMKDFNDLGLDSITMNSLLVHFQDKLDISMSPLMLLEYPNLDAVSRKLEKDYHQEFAKYFNNTKISEQ